MPFSRYAWVGFLIPSGRDNLGSNYYPKHIILNCGKAVSSMFHLLNANKQNDSVYCQTALVFVVTDIVYL